MIFIVVSLGLILALIFLRHKKWKAIPILKKGIFACLAISLCLVFLEIAMTIAEPYLFKGFYQYDPDLGFKVRPYSSGTNRFGFNDRDYEIDKPDELFRILVLGDSYSWAGGKESNYTAMLERKFESYYGGHRVDVINAGYPNTHTGEQFALLKKYGMQYEPDMVLVGFFAGNDFFDADPYRKRIVVNDTFYDIDRRFELRIMGRPVLFRSRIWHLLRQRVIAWKSLDKTHASDSDPLKQENTNDNTGTFSEEAFLEIEKLKLGFCHIPSQEKGNYRQNIDFILRTFTQMKEFLDIRNIELVVGIYPDEFQVDESLLSRIYDAFDLEREQFDIELAQRILKEHFSSEDISSVDLLDSFREKMSGKPLYLPRDTHWNEAGNELAAEVLFRFLVTRIDAAFMDAFGDTVSGQSLRPSL